MKPSLVTLCVCLCLAPAGCDERTEPATEGSAPGASAVATRRPAPDRPTRTRPPLRVPRISLASTPDATAAARAEQLNLQGMAAYRALDFETAIARFVAALEANPAAHQARYNLACALSRSGDGRAAIGQLEQLASPGCPECRDKLGRARKDKDLAILRGHPRFEALFGN